MTTGSAWIAGATLAKYLPDIALLFGIAFLLIFCLIVYPLGTLLLCGVSLIAIAVVLYRAERHTQ